LESISRNSDATLLFDATVFILLAQLTQKPLTQNTGSLHYQLLMSHCQHNYFYFLLLDRVVNEHNISRNNIISRTSQMNMNVELSKIITLFHIIHDAVINNFNIIKMFTYGMYLAQFSIFQLLITLVFQILAILQSPYYGYVVREMRQAKTDF
jgi:hypothetical protein